MRGRGAGGFQLGAVTAVRSPGDGGGVATAVDGEGELRKAFDTSAGEEGLLGLDGFRVSVFIVSLQGWLNSSSPFWIGFATAVGRRLFDSDVPVSFHPFSSFGLGPGWRLFCSDVVLLLSLLYVGGYIT